MGAVGAGAVACAPRLIARTLTGRKILCDGLAFGIGRHGAESILAAAGKNQGDGGRQALARFLLGPTLATGARDFRRIGDVPVPSPGYNGN